MQSQAWFGLAPATMVYTEAIVQGWIKQPSNAWTNAFYLLNALALFYLYHKNKKRPLALVFSVISFLVGLTSFLYHASNAFLFQFFDLASMYLLSGFLAALALVRLGVIQPARLPAAALAVFVMSSALLFFIRGKSGALIFGIEIIVILALEAWIAARKKRKTVYRFFFGALALLAASFLFWALDYQRLLFAPGNHIIQGHGLWHILNSFCFILMYIHYKQFPQKSIGV